MIKFMYGKLWSAKFQTVNLLYVLEDLHLFTVPDIPCQSGLINNSMDHSDCLR